MKIKFSLWWIVFFLLSLFSHQIQTYSLIFLMLLIHEFGHILCAHRLGYDVKSVMIYPFGCGACIENIDHGNLYEEFLIIFCGISMHLIYPLIFRILLELNVFSLVYYDYLMMMNRSIFLFNMLPIFPLDGGRIVDCFFHMFFVYGKARLFTMFTSLIFIIFLSISGWVSGISGIMVIIFLFIQIFVMCKDARFDRLAFYWYRYTHPLTTHVKVHKKLDLYRQRASVLLVEHEMIDEKQWLKRKFSTDKI